MIKAYYITTANFFYFLNLKADVSDASKTVFSRLGTKQDHSQQISNKKNTSFKNSSTIADAPMQPAFDSTTQGKIMLILITIMLSPSFKVTCLHPW